MDNLTPPHPRAEPMPGARVPAALEAAPPSPYASGWNRDEAAKGEDDKGGYKKAAGWAATLGLLALKFGAYFLKFKFVLLIFINVVLYTLLFSSRMGLAMGAAFAVGFITLLFLHECGHIVAAKREGLKVSIPYFIPFMGALIMLKEQPRDAKSEAIIGIGGPIAGTAASIITFFIGMAFPTGSNWHLFFSVLAGYGFWLNLINLIPATPLDGGRILGAVSKWFNLVGLLLLVALVAVHVIPLFFLIIFALIGGTATMSRFRHGDDPSYYGISNKAKALIGFSYLGVMAVTALGYAVSEGLLTAQL